MNRYSKRKIKIANNNSIWIKITIVAVIIICLTVVYRQYVISQRQIAAQEELKEQQQKLKEIEEKEKQLSQYETYLKSDEYIEDIARKKLNMLYPDEIMFECEE